MIGRWDDAGGRAVRGRSWPSGSTPRGCSGRTPALVLHGGGNTSVKAQRRTLWGEDEDLLYVKGSGRDLATIDEHGFAPVRLAAPPRPRATSRR